MSGPLEGIRVVELASIGPIPFCGMVLSDMGADVVRVDKPAEVAMADPTRAPGTTLDRNRRSIGVDLKQPDGVEVVMRLVERADVLIEGYRPGVAERLGLGPDDCQARNEGLVYGRLTGWGRDGPLAPRAGHDLDYIALSGALHAFGRAGAPPTPPMNVLGDFAGGGLLLAYGIACALVRRAATGRGDVVDAAMVDGAAMFMVPFYAARQIGFWSDERGTNLLDTGSPYYDTYECADGRWLAVGAIEPQFYAELLAGLGLEPSDVPDRDDRSQWDALRAVLADVIRTRTRDEWAAHFADRDACVAPVLSLDEAPRHPHNVARSVFVDVEDVIHPAPAPRFSEATTDAPRVACYAGQHTDEVLAETGYVGEEIAVLRSSGAIA